MQHWLCHTCVAASRVSSCQVRYGICQAHGTGNQGAMVSNMHAIEWETGSLGKVHDEVV